MEAGSLTIEMRQQTIEQVYVAFAPPSHVIEIAPASFGDKFAWLPGFGAVADDLQVLVSVLYLVCKVKGAEGCLQAHFALAHITGLGCCCCSGLALVVCDLAPARSSGSGVDAVQPFLQEKTAGGVHGEI